MKKLLASSLLLSAIVTVPAITFSEGFSNFIVNNTKTNDDFLVNENSKITYKNYYEEKDFYKASSDFGRSLPVDVLTNNLSTYLYKNPQMYYDVDFKDHTTQADIIIWVKKNIADHLFNDIRLFNKSRLDLYFYLNFNDPNLLKFLDLKYEKNNNEFSQKVIDELVNENFSDDDGIFYMIAAAPYWNDEKTIIDGEKYIGDWKEKVIK